MVELVGCTQRDFGCHTSDEKVTYRLHKENPRYLKFKNFVLSSMINIPLDGSDPIKSYENLEIFQAIGLFESLVEIFESERRLQLFLQHTC